MVASASDDSFMLETYARHRNKKMRAGTIKTIGDAAFERLTEQTAEFMHTGKWEEATPKHFVALYVILHTRLYGIAPLEMDSRTRALAAIAAARLIDKHFASDPSAMASFMRWAWTREVGREKYRKANGADGIRIGWRMQFGAALVTDYRLDKHRRR